MKYIKKNYKIIILTSQKIKDTKNNCYLKGAT